MKDATELGFTRKLPVVFDSTAAVMGTVSSKASLGAKNRPALVPT